MKTKDKLLERYYNGETTLEEEKLLKNLVFEEEEPSAEKDAFNWYQSEGAIPEELELSVYESLRLKDKNHNLRRKIYGIGAIAASIVLIFSLYLNIHAERKRKIESEFFVMERALFQVSESLQPYKEDGMLVLWVDDNVEILIE